MGGSRWWAALKLHPDKLSLLKFEWLRWIEINYLNSTDLNHPSGAKSVKKRRVAMNNPKTGTGIPAEFRGIFEYLRIWLRTRAEGMMLSSSPRNLGKAVTIAELTFPRLGVPGIDSWAGLTCTTHMARIEEITRVTRLYRGTLFVLLSRNDCRALLSATTMRGATCRITRVH